MKSSVLDLETNIFMSQYAKIVTIMIMQVIVDLGKCIAL